MTSSKNADKLIADRMDDLKKQEPLALRGLIHNLKSRPYEWYDDDIAALLEEYKADILKYITRKYHVGQVSLPTNDIKKLLSVGIQWPELTDLVNRYKTAIIKNVLETLKLDYRNVADTVGTLTSMNLGWKELDAINRSLNALRNNVNESSWYSDDEIEEIKTNIVHDLNGHYYMEVLDIIAQLKHDHADLGDVTNITPLLEKHKRGLITQLLTIMKHSSTYELHKYFIDFVNGLKLFGIDWPEFKTMLKSINADNRTLDESYSKNDAEQYKDEIINTLNKNDISDFFEILAEFAWIPRTLVGDVTKLNHALELHKIRVIKALLSYMRELDDSGICYIMPQILGGLEHAGIVWPELTVIDQSVNKMQKRREDEEELDERRNTVNTTAKKAHRR